VIGETIAWGVAALAVLLAGWCYVTSGRRLRAVEMARGAAERTHNENIASLTQARDELAQRLAQRDAELATLRTAQERLSAAFLKLPVPVWRRDGSHAIVDCNAQFAQAVEADRDTIVGEGRMLGGAVIAERARALAELAGAARTPQSEIHHIVIAGARRLIELTEAPTPDGGTIGIAVDMTEREEAEEELKRHIAAHGEVLENLATAIAIFGADTRLKFFNVAYSKLWRLDEPFLRGEPDYGEILEALRERRRLPEYVDFLAFKRQRLKLFTSLVEPIEELVYIPDGTTLRTRISPHPMGGLLFTYEDVTDNLVLERSYNTLIAVQRETLDNLYEGVAVIGSDGRIKLTNPAYARMWQIPAEVLRDEPHVSDIVERTRDYFEQGDDWPTLRGRIIERLTDRTPRAGRLTRIDGSVLDYACVPLPDGATLLSYVDVTDSIRVERALRERAEALEAADRLKSGFVSNISYELRTPLNTIIGFAEILANQYFGPLNARQAEYCSGILVSSERLLTIINDILDLASIEAGRMSLDRRSVQLRTVLEGVGTLTRDWLRNHDLQLTIECDSSLPMVEVDERRLKQALCNLVSNALNFTPPGGAIVLSGQIDGDRAVIVVADTGVGIAHEDQARVFKEFERGPSSLGRRTGAGLGLSLVKRIIELHGGSVDIDSAPSRGTTVTCIVPIRPQGPVAATEVVRGTPI
jgi:signal transduction histidine kinase